MTRKFRLNHQILASTVRLISDGEEQLGVVPTAQALQMAEEKGLDLVEVSPQDNPPVCKIMDYGKYVYRQQKADRKQKVKHKQGDIKGVRIGFTTGKHDLSVKAKQARRFLEDGDKVKVTQVFRGREISHFALGKTKLLTFISELADISEVEQDAKMIGDGLMVMLKPKK